MKKTIKSIEKEKKIYIVLEGYDYEGDTIIGAFSTINKAKQFIGNWKRQTTKDYGTNSIKLPTGYKFGVHYCVFKEMVLQ
jgi:hypothetical protein